MKSKIYEILRSKGILSGTIVNEEVIFKAPVNKLLDITAEISETSKIIPISKPNSSFSCSVATALSGARFPCRSTECRQASAIKLAQFSALYSDNVYIANYLSDYPSYEEEVLKRNHFDFRYDLYNDFKIFALLEPLIKAGLIIPYTKPSYCPVCDKENGLTAKSRQLYDKECARLAKTALEKIAVEAEILGGQYHLRLKGPEDLIPHGFTGIVSDSLPLDKNSALMRRLKKGIVHLTKKEIKRLELDKHVVYSIVHDIPLHIYLSKLQKSSFLTDNEKQINILNSMSGVAGLKKRNTIVEKNLTVMVPFINEVTLNDLIKLRKREAESFILFRKALNQAIDEYKNSGSTFTEKDAQEIYSEIIAPKLATLDLRISKAKRDLVKSTYRNTLSWVGALSFGIYSGLIPSNLINFVSSLGLAKTAADLINMTMTKSDGQESIKNDEMYFLWQVRQKAKSK